MRNAGLDEAQAGSRREGMPMQKTRGRGRESTRVRMSTGETGPWPFGFSFKFFFPPLGPALCKLGQPRVLFVLPEVLTLVLGPSFAQFLQAFPFLVF